MKLLGLLWRRYSLFCMLALTSLPLMLLGWQGRNTIYSGYDLDPVKEPGLALVFEGIHGGIFASTASASASLPSARSFPASARMALCSRVRRYQRFCMPLMAASMSET